jgi:signal transduction histidine kinase
MKRIKLGGVLEAPEIDLGCRRLWQADEKQAKQLIETALEQGVNFFDLADVFAEEVQQLRTAHPTRRIELSSSGELRGVWDAGRMHQVLGNLLSNALKYGKPDSTVEVVLAGTAEEVIFTVTNDGVKIDDDALRAFFDPLSRGHHPQAHRDQDGGLGLGLYICRQIALAHHGSIQARSDESQTVFEVRLPKRLTTVH